MNVTDISLHALFLAFLRLGATAYGGPAMMARLRTDLVDRRRWVTEADFNEGMALCQAVPGATMVQMCTYVGYRLRRLPGAVLAAAGFILPAFLAMSLLSAVYFRSTSLPIVRSLFRGLGAVVVAIVLDACVTLGKTTVRSWEGLVIALLALVAMLFHVNFVAVLAGAAGLAIPLYWVSERPRRGSGTPDA